MEPKKNPKADLENYRALYVLIGLVMALTITIFAIEFKSYDPSLMDLGQMEALDDDEIIPVTTREITPPPPPPPPPPQIIEVVDDDVELEEELEIESTETDETEEVEIIEVEEEESDEILSFAIVESVPVFPGCEDAKNNDERNACFQREITKFISQNFKFPEMARQMGLSGKVYVNFVIEKNGELSNIEVVRGVDPLLDNEALRVVKKLPKFQPAKQRGRPVRSRFTLPFNLKLQ